MRRERRTPATVVDQRGNTVVDGDADLSPAQRPVLIGTLEASERFHRDRRLGKIFHPGKISFREISVVDSLHIVIQGNRVSAHVDEISPLRRRRDGSIGYSLARILAHNISGACADVSRLLRGRQGEQRCNLECEVVEIDDDTEANSETGDTGPDCTTSAPPLANTPMTPAT